MKEIFTCKYKKCNKYLFNPIMLNCGNNICKSHLDDLIDQSKNEYQCFICNEEHKMPNDGFLINTALVQILNIKWHLDENEKQAESLLTKLQTSFDELEKITNDPDSFIFEYISDVRRNIDLERVRLIEDINSTSNEMLDKLKQLEDQCNKNLCNLKTKQDEQKHFLSNLSKDIFEWKNLLMIPTTNKLEIDKLICEANKMIKVNEEKIINNKNSLLMNQQCYFNSMNTKFDHKLFGDFYVGIDDKLKSSILTPAQSADLVELCKFDPLKRFKLLYRATRDGFAAENFHNQCDEIPNTLTIVKVKGNGNVFGGFTSQTWVKSERYKTDTKAFIFSLINKENLPYKINVTWYTKAIYCRKNYGPTFGGDAECRDIFISNYSNTNRKSYSNLGKCYANSLYPFESEDAQKFLAGSFNFTTEEIEVYHVV